MTAPDLSPAEAEILARFDAAPTLPEAYTPLSAVLDQLDELRAKATPGPWEASDGWDLAVAHDSGEVVPLPFDDAVLIVAAVNAVGPLTTAVRAVLELADELDRIAESHGNVKRWVMRYSAQRIRAAIDGDGR